MPLPARHVAAVAAVPPEGRAAPQPAKPPFDVFAPPMLLGATYLLLFGIGIIDNLYFDGRTRLRSSILYFRGLSFESLFYLGLTYVFFVVGYWLTPAPALARVFRPAEREWLPNRTSIVTTVFFLATFGLLVAYTITVGYGRYEVTPTGNEALTNLSLLGELSMIPYVMSLFRFAQSRRPESGARMSRWDRWFLWGAMAPAQLWLSIFIGIRGRAAFVLLLAVVAYHYGCRRVPMKKFILMGGALLFVLMPVLDAYRRNEIMLLPTESGSYSARAWQSVAGRTSAVETYTVIYENLERVPEPEPIYWALLTGLVPRFLWPNKPQYTFNERLTVWAVGTRRLSWMGPTLPGELVRLLGYVGALAFMVFLGALWRGMRDICRLDQQSVWIIVYLCSINTLLVTEMGFTMPYATMTRFVVVSTLLLLATTAPVRHEVPLSRAAIAAWRLRRAASF